MNDEPTSASALATQAFYLIERRRLDDARRILRGALQQFPQDPDLLFHSAQVDWLADNNEAAESTIRQLLGSSPEFGPARQLLSSLLIERGEFSEAERVLIELLHDYPESANLYGHYSRLMLRTLHLEKAEQLAHEGLRYDPDDSECLLSLALCETARNGARPNEGLAKLLAAHPESLTGVHALVIALTDAGRVHEAHRVAQAAMRADPANEHLVDLVRELRFQNHWSMKPLWPLQKWGWSASAAMWVGGFLITRMLNQSAPQAALPFACLWLAYAIYSWVWPSLLRRLL